jgi:hypothetical protein
MRATGSPVKTLLNRRGKGRTGIRGRRQDARQEGSLEILERHLARRISITVTGDSKQVSVLEAIVLQLIQKTLLGSERACRTLLKYQAFANCPNERKPIFFMRLHPADILVVGADSIFAQRRTAIGLKPFLHRSCSPRIPAIRPRFAVAQRRFCRGVASRHDGRPLDALAAIANALGGADHRNPRLRRWSCPGRRLSRVCSQFGRSIWRHRMGAKSDALQQSIDLAVAAEELGADGAYFRVHHFARPLASPFPLLAAVGAKTSRIEIGTAVIDMRYEDPLYMVEDAGTADLIAGGRLQRGISRSALRRWFRLRRPRPVLRAAEFGWQGDHASGAAHGGHARQGDGRPRFVRRRGDRSLRIGTRRSEIGRVRPACRLARRLGLTAGGIEAAVDHRAAGVGLAEQPRSEIPGSAGRAQTI